jgi:glycosyltransferase involved in cell wall biosynthesis
LLTPIIVDPISGSGAGRVPLGMGALRLAFVGNLYPGKRPKVFCELVEILRRRGVNATGILIGDGAERVAMETLVASRGLGPHLHLAGKQENAAVFEHLRGAHLLISTSIGEPYGRVIAEAMAIGTPCVCHRSGGPSDFITQGVDGELVGEATAEAYADAVEGIVRDPDHWRNLSEGAARTAAGWRSDVVLQTVERALYDLRSGGG